MYQARGEAMMLDTGYHVSPLNLTFIKNFFTFFSVFSKRYGFFRCHRSSAGRAAHS